MGARQKGKDKTKKAVQPATKDHEKRPFQHIVILHGERYFQAEFFRRYNLQPFKADLDTLDDDSDFIAHIMTSLEVNGWDHNRPLLYSIPADPDLPNAKELTGIVIDARHRSWGWQLRYEKGMWVPEPVCRPIPVTSVDHALILRAYYETLNRSKNAAVARKHAEKIIYDVFERRKFKDTTEAADFFKKNGFADSITVEQLFRKFMRKKEAAELKASKKNGPNRTTGRDVFKKAFGGKLPEGPKKVTHTENELPADDRGVSVTALCPECKRVLICPDCMKEVYVVKLDSGDVVFKHVESAMVIKH